MSTPNAADVPGMEQAYAAVRRVGGVLLTPEAARDLVLTVAAVLRPHLQAELYADIADSDMVGTVDGMLQAAGLFTEPVMAQYFDLVSDSIRERLHSGSVE